MEADRRSQVGSTGAESTEVQGHRGDARIQHSHRVRAGHVYRAGRGGRGQQSDRGRGQQCEAAKDGRNYEE